VIVDRLDEQFALSAASATINNHEFSLLGRETSLESIEFRKTVEKSHGASHSLLGHVPLVYVSLDYVPMLYDPMLIGKSLS
jgi:hypothetical protein